jgi:hypothetical protein
MSTRIYCRANPPPTIATITINNVTGIRIAQAIRSIGLASRGARGTPASRRGGGAVAGFRRV